MPGAGRAAARCLAAGYASLCKHRYGARRTGAVADDHGGLLDGGRQRQGVQHHLAGLKYSKDFYQAGRAQFVTPCLMQRSQAACMLGAGLPQQGNPAPQAAHSKKEEKRAAACTTPHLNAGAGGAHHLAARSHPSHSINISHTAKATKRRTCLLVLEVRTISSSGITWAGLKKCAPTMRSRHLVLAPTCVVWRRCLGRAGRRVIGERHSRVHL